jgi:hypothetical protein
VYADNAFFETSVWDLKVIFGQLEQHTGKVNIDWHTAVTMPWLQAKLLSYYLRVNLAAYELAHGNIKVPSNVQPPTPEPPQEEPVASDPTASALYEAAKRLHAEMFENA